jgi:hypothetical protein
MVIQGNSIFKFFFLINFLLRQIFILTDGDIGQKEHVFKLVKEKSSNARIFT